MPPNDDDKLASLAGRVSRLAEGAASSPAFAAKMNRWRSNAALLVSVVLLALAYQTGAKPLRLLRGGVVGNGVVVDHRLLGRGETSGFANKQRRPAWYSVVRFEYAGTSYELVSRRASPYAATSPKPPVGDAVSVLFDPKDPSVALLEDERHGPLPTIYLPWGFFALFGGFLLLVSLPARFRRS